MLANVINYRMFFQVEGLLEDIDFRLKVTREDLDAMCSDLYDRVQEPVRQALEAADMTLVSRTNPWLLIPLRRLSQTQSLQCLCGRYVHPH